MKAALFNHLYPLRNCQSVFACTESTWAPQQEQEQKQRQIKDVWRRELSDLTLLAIADIYSCLEGQPGW